MAAGFGLSGRFVDDPRTTLSRKIPTNPLDSDEKALLEIDEEIDVNDCPKQPGCPPFHRPLSKVEYSRVAADHCRIAAIFEREA